MPDLSNEQFGNVIRFPGTPDPNDPEEIDQETREWGRALTFVEEGHPPANEEELRGGQPVCAFCDTFHEEYRTLNPGVTPPPGKEPPNAAVRQFRGR